MSEAGRGRKQCKNCKEFVGVRSKICSNCQTSFDNSLDIKDSLSSVKDLVSKVSAAAAGAASANISFSIKKEVQEEEFVKARYTGKTVICVPAGSPPVKPQGFTKGWTEGPATDEVISQWAKDVFAIGDGHYAVDAVIYWARYFWDITSPEFQRVKMIILDSLAVKEVQNEDDLELQS